MPHTRSKLWCETLSTCTCSDEALGDTVQAVWLHSSAAAADSSRATTNERGCTIFAESAKSGE